MQWVRSAPVTELREALTIVAAALVALLTAALVGPWLIDWTAHRDLLDAEISRALAADVRTRGAIDLKLLPTPILALDGFDIAGEGFSAHAGRTRLELQVMPLLRGELRFYEVSIDEPDVSLRAPLAASANPPAATRLDRAIIANARVRLLDDTGKEIAGVSSLDLDGASDSLRGPFRGAGSLRLDATAISFRFTTGAIDDGRLRLKLVADETVATPRVDLDGAIDFSDPAHPAFEGQSVLAATAPVAWRLSGPLRLDAGSARFDKLEARLEGGESASTPAAVLEGTARMAFGAAPMAQANLSARQIDLERLSAHPAFAFARKWLADSRSPGRLDRAVEVTIATPAALLAGDTLSDVETSIRLAPGAEPAVRLSIGGGPGGSRLSLNGEVETGAASAFRGHATFAAQDLPRFVEFLAPFAPEAGGRLRATPTRKLDLDGDVSLSAAGFSARNLSITADRTSLSGAAAFTLAVGDNRARFFADFASEAFDLDTAPDLTAPAAALADADLAITLNARAIRVARFGDGSIDAGHIQLGLKREGETTRLEQLSIADLGGATLSVTGTANAAAGHAEGSIAANRLGDLAAFLRRIAPGAVTDALATRATTLSPTNLTFRLDASRAGPDAPLAISSLSLDGVARGTSIKAAARPDGAGNTVTGSLSLASADAAMLARQIGVASTGGATTGAARIDVAAHGAMGRGFDIETTAHAAGATATFRGRVEGVGRAAGDATLDAPDVAALLRLFGAGLPDATLKPAAQLATHVSAEGDKLALSAISGAVAGASVSGEMALAPDDGPAPRSRWTGSLHVGALSAPALAQLVLGPQRSLKPGETWSLQRFAAGMSRAPLADVDIVADQLQLNAGARATNARLKLSLAPTLVAASDISANIAGGSLANGRVSLRRDGDVAALTAAAQLENVAIDRPAFAGVLSGRFEVTSTGDTPAALAGGLAGQGAFSVSNLSIPKADPAAPGRVLARADSGDLFMSENDILGSLRRELDAAPFQTPAVDFDATIAGGNFRLASRDGVALSWNAATGEVESRVTLAASPLPRTWDGPAPRLGVVWKGPVDAPVRDIDAGLYDAAVIAHAVAREQERIEALEADMRERAAFVRRQRGIEFMNQRDREVAAWQAEQERLTRIEEQRRADEAARAERDRRAAEERARAEAARKAAAAAKEEASPQAPAPLDIAPLAHPPIAQPPVAPAITPDPSAAGRY